MTWNLVVAAQHAHTDTAREKEKGVREKRKRTVIFQFFDKQRGSGGWQRNFLQPASCFPSVSFFFLSHFHLFQILSAKTLCSLFPHFNFSLSLFLRLSSCLSPYILFNLAQLCLLVTYVSWQFSLFGLGNRRKPWLLHVLSFSVLTKHWLFMTANSHTLCVYAPIPVFCSVSHFHTFSACFLSETSLPPSFPPFFLPLSLLGAAPAVWEQIGLLLLGFGKRTRLWSHLWERGRAS